MAFIIYAWTFINSYAAIEAQQTRASPHEQGALKLLDLPKDALLMILNKLEPEAWFTTSSVSPKLRNICFDIIARSTKDYNLLELAISRGHLAAVRVLLANSADANELTLDGHFLVKVVPSSSPNRRTIIQALCKAMDVNARNRDGQTPLHSAVAHDDLVAVKALLAAGADPNAHNNYNIPLIGAALGNSASIAVVKALVAAGADVHIRSELGGTLLHSAACLDNCGNHSAKYAACITIKWLINECGIDPNAVDGEICTLLLACSSEYSQGKLDCARELLKAGANVNAVSNAPTTPLDLAAHGSEPPMIQLLLEYGANLCATLENGLTPAELESLRNHNPAVAKLLREAEVKRSTERASALENDSIDMGRGESKSKKKRKERP